jgi:lysozyme
LNLRDREFKESWAEFILRDILNDLTIELEKGVLIFNVLSDVRKSVLLDMAFQLGVGGLTEFTGMLFACAKGNFADAASKMLQSKWAKETPKRAATLSWMMEHDSFQIG